MTPCSFHNFREAVILTAVIPAARTTSTDAVSQTGLVPLFFTED